MLRIHNIQRAMISMLTITALFHPHAAHALPLGIDPQDINHSTQSFHGIDWAYHQCHTLFPIQVTDPHHTDDSMAGNCTAQYILDSYARQPNTMGTAIGGPMIPDYRGQTVDEQTARTIHDTRIHVLHSQCDAYTDGRKLACTIIAHQAYATPQYIGDSAHNAPGASP